MTARERLIVALDTADLGEATELAARLRGRVGGFKIGLELFVAEGPRAVERVRKASEAPIFLDLKLHDIPNTVRGAAASAARLGIRWLSLHALGGEEAIRRARQAALDAARKAGLEPPKLLAVTILTSHAPGELSRIGIEGSPSEAALRLAELARSAGAGGIVCSPLEVASVRKLFPEGELVVAGVRPRGLLVAGDDQARAAGPAEAVERGADRIVVGRPITGAPDPAEAAARVVRELEGG